MPFDSENHGSTTPQPNSNGTSTVPLFDQSDLGAGWLFELRRKHQRTARQPCAYVELPQIRLVPWLARLELHSRHMSGAESLVAPRGKHAEQSAQNRLCRQNGNWILRPTDCLVLCQQAQRAILV